MSKLRRYLSLAALGLLLLPGRPARADELNSLELKSGEVLIGRILSKDEKTVKIAVEYPKAETRMVLRSELTPVSQFRLLQSDADLTQPKEHLRLAKAARDLSLYAFAIAEYHEAARLDPKLEAMTEREVQAVEATVAADLLGTAKSAMEDKRYAAAHLALRSILDHYPDTPSAQEAAKLFPGLLAMEKGLLGGPLKSVSVNYATRALDRAKAQLKAAGQVAGGETRPTVLKQRTLQRVIARLEAAWQAVRGITAPVEATEVNGNLNTVRKEVRDRLLASYLQLGKLYLQRRALPSAENYAEKVCSLDPDNPGCHELNSLILDAKLFGNYWPVSPSRPDQSPNR